MRPQDCSRTETSHEFRETVKPQLALNSGEAHLAAAENAQGKLATHALHNGICEAHVRRKLDRHMMPLLFVLCKLALPDFSWFGSSPTANKTCLLSWTAVILAMLVPLACKKLFTYMVNSTTGF